LSTPQTVAYPQNVKIVAQQQAELILNEIEGVQAVVVATIDGFEIAAAIRTNLLASRISALASSIASIGEVVSLEAQLGEVRSVTVDTTSGVAMIYTVRRQDSNFVLIVIADSRALIGQISYRTAAAARSIAAAN
jgi:predicted regulator of Ras-like GTPase activity (Roadblock/LC7/MglB family)